VLYHEKNRGFRSGRVGIDVLVFRFLGCRIMALAVQLKLKFGFEMVGFYFSGFKYYL
jgi:hypothetical protein